MNNYRRNNHGYKISYEYMFGGGKPKTFPFSQTFASGAERTFTVKVNENAKKERTALDNIQFTYSGNTLGISSILAIAQISSVV